MCSFLKYFQVNTKMKSQQINIKKPIASKIMVLTVCLSLMAVLNGCFDNYGRVKRNAEITQVFEANQVPSDYKYYYFGHANMPYVIIGIDPDYNLQSRIWREVAPDTERFKKMTYWVWSDSYYYPNYPRGAEIVDPTGKKIGIWYSSARWAAVKMKDDQGNIMIAPDMPWMLGTR